MACMNQADGHIANNDLASAREAVKQALHHASGNPQLSAMLSNILDNLRDSESARKFLRDIEANH
jgi:thioredoxin-like negative regulator of GroEL